MSKKAKRKKLWESPPFDWLPFGLPASQLLEASSLPPALQSEIFAEVVDFGPNWQHVIKAVEVIVPSFANVGSKRRKKLQQGAGVHIFDTPASPPSVDANIQKILNEALDRTFASSNHNRDVVGSSMTAFLDLVAWSGFVRKNLLVEGSYMKMTADICAALNVDFHDYTWVDPNSIIK